MQGLACNGDCQSVPRCEGRHCLADVNKGLIHHLATDKGEFPAKPGELAGGFIGQDSGLVSPGLPAGLSGALSVSGGLLVE